MQADLLALPLPRVCALLLLTGSASAQWPQWGGPERDFRSSATGLADAWPEAGPVKTWERALGAGYSSVVADGGLLFTLYRSGEDEVVVALDASTGATRWEHRYRGPDGGEPPNSTPTVAGERVYALGVAGRLCALEKASGKLVWSLDLVAEHRVKRPQFGFATSPLVHGEALVVPLGGAGSGVAAFALADGALLWKRHDLEEVYASPIRIEVEGESQIVVLAAGRIVGLSPESGEMLWSEPLEGDQNIATPVWSPDGLLCVTATPVGSLAFRLTRAEGKTRVERVWTNDRQISQTTVVRVGDYYYGCTGHDPFFVTAIHAKTGEIAWREPGFSLANLVAADGKIVLLDSEGVLALGTAGADGWKTSSRTKLLEPQAFTPPTVAGTSVYLRDLQKVLALDLSVR